MPPHLSLSSRPEAGEVVVLETGFALAVQQLVQATRQVLVLGQLAGYRNGDRRFTEEDVLRLFDELRVPTPDVRRAIRQLGSTHNLVTRADGRLSLTPEGDRRVADLFGDLDLDQLEPQLVDVPGAELGHARHTVIPWTLAPAKWADGIRQYVEDDHPFDTNVFCMTRFPRDEQEQLPDPVRYVIDGARDVLAEHGLTLHLASDAIIDDDLWGNVAAHGWASRYGIGLFEKRVDDILNPNLIIEVGAMMMTGRRCALLRDKTVDQMPTDFVGQIYKGVDFDDTDAVAKELHRWCANDLGLGRCAHCPP
jgi:hypothetical protein